jgi:small-conductance mechanosensitive channel
MMFVFGSQWQWLIDAVSRIERSVMSIDNKLNQLLAKEARMAVDLTALTNEVARNATVEQSVLALVQGMAAQLAAIPPSSDPTTQAAIDGLKATLQANDDALADAVSKNTPAAGA